MRTKEFVPVLIVLSLLGCNRDTHINEDETTGVNDLGPIATPYDLKIPEHFPNSLAESGNPLTQEGVELGRRLFYDPILSENNKMSCASCHKQEKGFSDSKRFSLGAKGVDGRRTSMSLVNLAWRSDLFWDGRAESLEEQALDPITNPLEMNTTWGEVEEKLNAHEEYPKLFQRAFEVKTIDSSLVVKALAQFERTLISSNSKFDRYLNREVELSPLEQEGLDLFTSTKGSCSPCHNGVFMTDFTFRNNGLQTSIEDQGRYEHTGNDRDRGKFIVPSLRNIEVTGPYMHDGRFETPEEVIEFYNSGVNQESPNIDPVMLRVNRREGSINLTEHQKKALIAFLKL